MNDNEYRLRLAYGEIKMAISFISISGSAEHKHLSDCLSMLYSNAMKTAKDAICKCSDHKLCFSGEWMRSVPLYGGFLDEISVTIPVTVTHCPECGRKLSENEKRYPAP